MKCFLLDRLNYCYYYYYLLFCQNKYKPVNSEYFDNVIWIVWDHDNRFNASWIDV